MEHLISSCLQNSEFPQIYEPFIDVSGFVVLVEVVVMKMISFLCSWRAEHERRGHVGLFEKEDAATPGKGADLCWRVREALYVRGTVKGDRYIQTKEKQNLNLLSFQLLEENQHQPRKEVKTSIRKITLGLLLFLDLFISSLD